MRPRTLHSYAASSSFVIGLALAGGCLNPRPEDFPSRAELDSAEDGAWSGGSPGNSIGLDPAPSGDNFSDDPASRPAPTGPSAPAENGADGDAGAPQSDGGTAAAAAQAASADGGAGLDGEARDPR